MWTFIIKRKVTPAWFHYLSISLLQHVYYYIACIIYQLCSETEWKSMEKRVRTAIKQVVPCDLMKASIFEEPIRARFDLVITCLCLEVACTTYEVFHSTVGKVADILKPGGHIIMISVLDESFYQCGVKSTSNKFFCLPLTESTILNALGAAGLTIQKKLYQTNTVKMEDCDFKGVLALLAKKV